VAKFTKLRVFCPKCNDTVTIMASGLSMLSPLERENYLQGAIDRHDHEGWRRLTGNQGESIDPIKLAKKSAGR